MKKNSTIFFLAMVFILPFTAYALVNWYAKKYESLPVYGITEEKGPIRKDHTIQDFLLINQDGKKLSTVQWKNKIVVANFFFTHCPVVCPKMMLGLKKVEQAFRQDDGILVNSFTVDPESDSVAQLKRYATRFGINTTKWDLLTGDKKEIYKLARNSFMIVATDGDGGPEDFIHSDRLVLVDKRKRIRGYYDGTSESETNQLIKDIKRIQDEN